MQTKNRMKEEVGVFGRDVAWEVGTWVFFGRYFVVSLVVSKMAKNVVDVVRVTSACVDLAERAG